MNLTRVFPIGSLLHHHDQETCIQYLSQSMQGFSLFGERKDYFQLVAQEKISWRRWHLSCTGHMDMENKTI